MNVLSNIFVILPSSSSAAATAIATLTTIAAIFETGAKAMKSTVIIKIKIKTKTTNKFKIQQTTEADNTVLSKSRTLQLKKKYNKLKQQHQQQNIK